MALPFFPLAPLPGPSITPPPIPPSPPPQPTPPPPQPVPTPTPQPVPQSEPKIKPGAAPAPASTPVRATTPPAQPRITPDTRPPAQPAAAPVIVSPPAAIPATELCPTCHSRIGTGNLSESARIQGSEGVDTEGNPVPFWTDDPLFTPRGMNGTAYKKFQRVRKVHIEELQEYRQLKEIEAGISPATLFSDVETDSHVSRRHIIELRESTEKILSVSGLTLQDYFKLDPNGAEQAQNPSLVDYGATVPQAEWVDVNRGETYINKDGQSVSTFNTGVGTEQSPTLPSKTRVRGIHVEDLRHPLVISVFDSFFHTPNVTGVSGIDPGN